MKTGFWLVWQEESVGKHGVSAKCDAPYSADLRQCAFFSGVFEVFGITGTWVTRAEAKGARTQFPVRD
jgi:hypothetical protein